MRLARTVYSGLAVTWVICALCVCVRPAYAYADPGSGLFLMQVAGTTFLGLTYFVRNKVRRVLLRIFRTKKLPSADTAS